MWIRTAVLGHAGDREVGGGGVHVAVAKRGRPAVDHADVGGVGVAGDLRRGALVRSRDGAAIRARPTAATAATGDRQGDQPKAQKQREQGPIARKEYRGPGLSRP